jgi:tetratricopeptide (TPR) repeat protein
LLDESLEYTIGGRSTAVRAWTLVATGQIRGALGDHTGALAAFAEAASLSRQSGDRFFVPIALQGMARALRHLDRLEEAARLLAAAQNLADSLGIPGGPADVAARERAAARLRELLGDERFDTEWDVGRALSFDAAATLAAEATAPPDGITSA